MQRRRGAQPHAADVVEAELGGRLVAVQRVHVEAVGKLGDHRPDVAGGVLEPPHAPRGERPVGHPGHHRIQVLALRRPVVGPAEQIATGDVEVVGEAHDDAHGREGLLDGVRHPGRAVEHLDGRDGALEAARQHDDVVAGLQHAAGDRAGVAAVVVVRVRHRADHPLDGQADVDEVAVAGDVDVLRNSEGEAIYRRCSTDNHHHHLVCRSCGHSVEIASAAFLRAGYGRDKSVALFLGNTPDHPINFFGALKAGGRTIGVLGSGVDKIYPPEHRQLAERMAESGAIVSDYAPGTPPDASNFPPRNRIISGLSLAVVVIEAGGTSGALITAEFAAEQGREVFAVPGSILAPQSKGTNKLIQNGALPLLSVNDLMQALDITRVGEQKAARKIMPADAIEAKLMTVLTNEPLHVDEIRNQSELPIEKVSAALVLMELKGMVRQVGGMNYVALREEDSEYRADQETGT